MSSKDCLELVRVFFPIKNPCLTYNYLMEILGVKIDDLDFSIRTQKLLASASMETLGDLVMSSEEQILKIKYSGKKSLNEIKEKLDEFLLKIDMNLSRYEISKYNLKNKLEEYKKKVENNEHTRISNCR